MKLQGAIGIAGEHAFDEGLLTRVDGVSPSGLMVGSTVQLDDSGTYSLKEVGFIMR